MIHFLRTHIFGMQDVAAPQQVKRAASAARAPSRDPSARPGSIHDRSWLQFVNQRKYHAEELVSARIDAFLSAFRRDSVVPFTKSDEDGFYMYGTRKIQLAFLQDRLMVRWGGGFVTMLDFINKHSDTEFKVGEEGRTYFCLFLLLIFCCWYC